MQQISTQLAITIAAIGGFAGAVVSALSGLFLQYRLFLQQREQWLVDKKTEEYRELISTLASNTERMARYSPDFGMQFPDKTDDQVRVVFDRAASRGNAVIQDRIFVAHVVVSHDILGRWQLLAGERDMNKFWDYWRHLHRDIIEAARKDLKVKGALPRVF